MRSQILSLLLVFLAWLGTEAQLQNTSSTTTTTTTSNPACAGLTVEWLAWSEWSSCSDTCGSCGIHTRTRTCLSSSSECNCAGESTMIEYCNLFVCKYPRSFCCYNFQARPYSGSFACLDATGSNVGTSS